MTDFLFLQFLFTEKATVKFILYNELHLTMTFHDKCLISMTFQAWIMKF